MDLKLTIEIQRRNILFVVEIFDGWFHDHLFLLQMTCVRHKVISWCYYPCRDWTSKPGGGVQDLRRAAGRRGQVRLLRILNQPSQRQVTLQFFTARCQAFIFESNDSGDESQNLNSFIADLC